MVGGERTDHATFAATPRDHRRGQYDGRGGIPGNRLGENIVRIELWQLLAHGPHMPDTRTHVHIALAGNRLQPVVSGLDERTPLPQQVVQKLRPVTSAQRPQSCARAAGGNNRMEVVETSVAAHVPIVSQIDRLANRKSPPSVTLPTLSICANRTSPL